MVRLRFSTLAINLAMCCALAAGSEDFIELIDRYEEDHQVVKGEWSKIATGIDIQRGRASRCIVAKKMPLDYSVDITFTRNSGDDAIAMVIPVGDASPSIEIGSWKGIAHGMSRVKGMTAKDPNNPTATRPGPIENNKEYRLQIEVSASGEGSKATVTARLNGQLVVEWQGDPSDLEANRNFKLPEKRALALAAYQGMVTFHSVKLCKM